MADYSYGSGRYRLPENRHGRGRFVLIFLIVSTLTAGIIWYFYRQSQSGERNVPAEKQQPVSAEQPTSANQETQPDIHNAAGSEANDHSESAKEKNLPLTGKEEKSPADPVLPDKGVITPADRMETDMPEVPAAPLPAGEMKESLKTAAAFLAAGKYAEAEAAGSKLLTGVKEDSAFYRQIWQVLTPARSAMMYSKEAPGGVVYTIRSGDSLSSIAQRYHTTVDLLRRVNNIKGSLIFVGRKLKITPGPWSIEVSKSRRLLKLYRHRKKNKDLFAVYEVGVGRFGRTPAAEFVISARVRHPDWYLPDGRVFKYGQPENQLGDYFLKLAPVKTPGRPLLGYGIHGAKDESTVGRSLSNGCIRMRNKDVEDLYCIIPPGSRVNIVE